MQAIIMEYMNIFSGWTHKYANSLAQTIIIAVLTFDSSIHRAEREQHTHTHEINTNYLGSVCETKTTKMQTPRLMDIYFIELRDSGCRWIIFIEYFSAREYFYIPLIMKLNDDR